MTEWSKPHPSSRVVVQAGARVPAATSEAQTGNHWVEVPTEFDAIMLSSYGGPNGQDDVIPFLRNVTLGRNIPDERLEEVAVHYREAGGVSPINEQNLALKASIEEELKRRNIDLPVYFGNRNWDPYFTEAISRAHEENKVEGRPTKIFALVTSAYSAYSSDRQYREDFADALEALDLWDDVQIDTSRHFFDHPGFVNPFIEGTREAIAELVKENVDLDLNKDVEVLFSAHSIPIKDNALSGDPDEHDYGEVGAYKAQHLALGGLVMDAVKEQFGTDVPWKLVYQSESGPAHIPWLEPDINDYLEDISSTRKAVVVVPATFLSDHMEVWWDLDIEAKETAAQQGLGYKRVSTPGVHPDFVAAMVDLVEERLNGTPASQRKALTKYGPGYDVRRAGSSQGSGPLRAATGGLLP
ncbi:MAG: ferrochelatase [Yaniella sp.]|uniref:ferrochelatase n=1 Tax=Yaniella sp. TaxID=2773929 RepID=UPI00264AEFD3|nr:ferrochelatase [Yaniella sp.]MDN6149026.1 ferrochelatase [Yaniella sp.]MDN6150949.1 ferrochelatase [Yaniella sp.]MDN6172319.1 ferrochelatase [Yaniella sp.]MDN6350734.1 ferrochelatase [Yaniella sp.]